MLANYVNFVSALKSVLRVTIGVRDLEANAAPLRDLNLWYRNNMERLGITTRVFFETQNTAGVRVVDERTADARLAGRSTHRHRCRPFQYL